MNIKLKCKLEQCQEVSENIEITTDGIISTTLSLHTGNTLAKEVPVPNKIHLLIFSVATGE